VPLADIIVRLHAQRPSRQNKGPLGAGEIAADDLLLVLLGAARLHSGHEARSNPDAAGALHQAGGQTPSVGDAACGNHEGVLLAAQELGLVLPRHVHDGRDQDAVGDVARVSATLTALRAHHVDTQLQSLDGMLGVSDHVHDQNAGVMQPVDDALGRDAHGGHKQLGARLDGDVDQLVQLAVGVVVVGLAGVAADLGEGEVDAEGQVRGFEKGLHLGDDFPQLVGRVHEAADDAETAGVGDGGGQCAARGARHAGEDDGVFYPQELSQRRCDGAGGCHFVHVFEGGCGGVGFVVVVVIVKERKEEEEWKVTMVQ